MSQPGPVPVGFPPPPTFYAYPPVPSPTPGPRRWRRVALISIMALMALGLVWQQVRLINLANDVDDLSRATGAQHSAGETAMTALDGRVDLLEKSSFRPDQIAETALKSVFRVIAGRYTGTAFAIGVPSPSGGTYLLTNYHVVAEVWQAGERSIAIEHRDLRYDATIRKVEKTKDLALLETTQKFPVLATSRAELRPGEPIVIAGAPLGLDSTVTTGVISATRDLAAVGGHVIQFDAAINPGNSGGPVIDAQLRVVGIASAKFTEAEGIGFGIPIAVACDRFSICG
jgi:putative serine protease PepD